MRGRKAYTKLKMLFAFVMAAVLLVTVQGPSMKHIEAAPSGDMVVNIPDENFKAILNKALGVSDPAADITAAQLATIKVIDADRDQELKNLTGIEYCTSLTKLRLEYCRGIEDLSPIYGLTNLTYLNIEQISWTEETKPGSLRAIASLVNLEYFSCGYIGLKDEDVYIFDGMTKLDTLIIGMNEITDGSFLVKHRDTLKELTLHGCSKYDDVDSIKLLTNLVVLGVGNTSITDYSFISSLPKMSVGSIRWAEWSDSFNTITHNNVDVYISDEQPTFTYDNIVRDKNGNLVAPEESDEYTYDAATGKITIIKKPGSFGSQVVYNMNTTTVNGDQLYARHTTNITNCYISINRQPEDKNITVGSELYLEVRASSKDKELSYQWYKDGKAIEGAVSSSLTVDKASKADEGSYYVVIKNKLGSEKSKEAKVTLYAPLAITMQPSDISLNTGESGVLSVTATGENLTYQWYKDGVAITGAVSSSYTIKNASEDDAGRYYVKVTDKSGSIKSQTAVVRIEQIETQPTTEEVTTEPETTEEVTTESATEEVTTESATEEVTTEPETTGAAETSAADTTAAAGTTAANASGPSTGDGSLSIIYILLIMLSLFMIIAAAKYIRKEN